MQTLPLAEVRARLSALVDEVERTAERVTITRNGHPVAVVLTASRWSTWRTGRRLPSRPCLSA